MKIFLLALNTSYSHSNPALYILGKAIKGENRQIVTGQWTINTRRENILASIYQEKPDIIGFSSYIWNISLLEVLAEELERILPDAILIFGGPQATGEKEKLLKRCPSIDGLVIGEGEGIWEKLISRLEQGEKEPRLPGVFWQGQKSFEEADRPDLSQLPFPYTKEELRELKGKIIYYEASRGCPYGCIFCFSAHEPLRVRSLSLVKEDLAFLAENYKGQFKLVDRTFNAGKERALKISQYLLELYSPDISWHLEISPYYLPDDLLELWQKAPAGYLRLEAGVQSLNHQALSNINRQGDWQKAKKSITAIMEKDNLSLHLDLIAGLPEETFESFEYAFNEVHELMPHYLQLGFLKVLPGSLLEKKAQDFGMIYSPYPPYRILSTPTLSPEKLFTLQRIEEMVDSFYNCGRFRQTLYFAGRYWPKGAISFYLALAEAKASYGEGSLSLSKKAELLWQLLKNLPKSSLFYDLIRLDWYFYGKGEPLPGIFRSNREHNNLKNKEITIALNHRIEFIQGGKISVKEDPAVYGIDQKQRYGVSNRSLCREI